MIRFKRITDEVIYKVIMSDINKYLCQCARERIDNKDKITEISNLQNSKYSEILKKFVEIFSKSFTEKQLNIMLNRLNTLKISKVTYKNAYLYCFSLGYYDSNENEIVIEYYKDRRTSKDSVEETLIHELVHMASTRKTKDGNITGFEIPYYIGINLNEGYTEYITEKYFTKGNDYVKSKSINLFLAKGIENIIGQERMQELFFDANLKGLIDEIAQYDSRDNIIRLLFLMDRSSRVMRGSRDLYNIVEEIAKINAKKLEKEFNLGLLTYEEYQIQYAIKVEEYLKGNMWSEETKVHKDDNSFVLSDQGFTSSVYEFNNPEKNKVKYYQ